MFYKNNNMINITFIDKPICGPIPHTTNWPTDVMPQNGTCCSNGITDWTFSLHIILIEKSMNLIDILRMS
jgi:hypothetical protein